MKMNTKRYTLLALLLIVFSGSCQKEPKPGGTALQAMANEWWVQADGAGDYFHFATYNTADNSTTQMWIDDMDTFWQMKGKISADLSNLTFSGNNIENVDLNYVGSGETFTVANGKIIPNGAKGPASKAVTDSIYFEVSFSDDPVPGTVYKMSGYARTRFADDDH